MEFHDWEPVYEAILDDFGYDRVGDERARDLLGDLVDDDGIGSLPDLQANASTVAVAGAGPSLEDEVGQLDACDRVFAASTAADRLADLGVSVDCVVTDLDKHPERVVEATRAGTPAVVHAHSDNRALLTEHVPTCDLEYVIATAQARPIDSVRNFGGFTDGDRAAFLADHLGGARLVFAGWDFDDPAVGPAKARKLAWAERLLYWLEHRRDERFDVLDGRRDSIDTNALPID